MTTLPLGTQFRSLPPSVCFSYRATHHSARLQRHLFSISKDASNSTHRLAVPWMYRSPVEVRPVTVCFSLAGLDVLAFASHSPLGRG
eukprot:scaffold154007_cov40-Tisochrysis_lutea.AAC.3